MVGVAGFEPAASWTRTMRDTKLRHTPNCHIIITMCHRKVKYEMISCPVQKVQSGLRIEKPASESRRRLNYSA